MDMTTSPAPDLAAVKRKQQATWAAGDYAAIGTTLQIVGETLCEALDLRAGERVLDVAAGNGNATLAAARRGAGVVSTDYVPELLERGRARAAAEGVTVTFEVADAEQLQYADGRFDVVLSTFGVMFTPDQERAAAELARVCRPGGRIGLANWTPTGFIGELFSTVGRHLPPPAGVRPASLWGMPEHLQTLFEGCAGRIEVATRQFVFRYRSPQHWLDTFRTTYGPMHKAFAALDPAGRDALEQDLLALAQRHNRGGDALVAPSDYLEAVIHKR